MPTNHMDKLNEKQQQRMLDMLKTFEGSAVQPEELTEIVKVLLEVIAKVKEQFEQSTEEQKNTLTRDIQEVVNIVRILEQKTDSALGEVSGKAEEMTLAEVSKIASSIKNEMEKMRGDMPTMPDLSLIESKLKQSEADMVKCMSGIPTVEMIEKDIPKLGLPIRDSLELLQGDDRLDKSAIKNLNEELKRIESIKTTERQGGVARGVQLYVDSLKKGMVNAMNIKAGTGTVLTYSQINGLDTITISASAVSAGYQSPTGSVNGTNKTFVFAVAPNVILVDGITMRATASDSTVNWTIVGTTVTLTIAPTFEIFSVA